MNSHDVIQLQRSYLCLAFAFFLFLVRSELDHFNLLVSLAFAFFVFSTDGLSDLSGRSVGQTVCVRPFSFSFFVVGLR